MTRNPYVVLIPLPVAVLMSAAPVDGAWTGWSGWNQCTKTCGGGVMSRTRTCTDPVPTNGGQNCVGSASETLSCNTGTCPDLRKLIQEYFKIFSISICITLLITGYPSDCFQYIRPLFVQIYFHYSVFFALFTAPNNFLRRRTKHALGLTLIDKRSQ